MKNIFYIIIFLLSLISCSSESDYIRDVYVNIEINLSLPEYSELNTIGNSILIEGGNKGIIIYKMGINEYKVYDRNCSYEPSLQCSYIDSISSTIAYCGCCSSAFLLDNNGLAVNSPALLPLKMYNWSLSNNIILRIFN